MCPHRSSTDRLTVRDQGPPSVGATDTIAGDERRAASDRELGPSSGLFLALVDAARSSQAAGSDASRGTYPAALAVERER